MQPKLYQPIALGNTKRYHKALHTDEGNFEVHKITIKENSITKMDRSFNIAEQLLSSDDDVPLSNVKQLLRPSLKEINFQDLSQPRQNISYDIVYDSPDLSEDEVDAEGEKPSTSSCRSEDKENKSVCCGDYLLVNVHATKGNIYKYACVVNNLDDDGELRLTFIRCVKNKKVFRLDTTDIADIDYSDIVNILPKPMTIAKRGQVYYEFKENVEMA